MLLEVFIYLITYLYILFYYFLIIATIFIGCNSTNGDTGGIDEAVGRSAPDFTYS